MRSCYVPILLEPRGLIGRITFTDTFTGVDGSAPNARWNLALVSGWEINTNHLRFTGGSVSYLLADCTAGNNTMSVDLDVTSASSSFAGIIFNYTDANNYNYVTLNGSELLRIGEVIAGTPTDLLTDGGGTRTGGAANLQVVHTGTSVTVTVTGGPNPGSFGPQTITRGNVGTKCGVQINTGKTVDFFDNFVLA